MLDSAPLELLVAAGIRLRGAAAVQLVQRQGISRVGAILQSLPALQRKLTAEQDGILKEAETAQTDGLRLGVDLLVCKKAVHGKQGQTSNGLHKCVRLAMLQSCQVIGQKMHVCHA